VSNFCGVCGRCMLAELANLRQVMVVRDGCWPPPRYPNRVSRRAEELERLLTLAPPGRCCAAADEAAERFFRELPMGHPLRGNR